MCADCGNAVRDRLQMRVSGQNEAADAGDRDHGIDTRGTAGKWTGYEIIEYKEFPE